MRCDCLCCVMSRAAGRCHVMCAHVMSYHLLCSPMEWNVMSLRRHWLWGHVVWFEVVLWRCGDPKYYSVLQRTTPVLLCTTKYYSSTTKSYCSTTLYYKVQRTTPVLRCTTKYYKVLLQYHSDLQSTTPVLLCTTKYHSWLILVTYEPSFRLRGATALTLQPHQILRLPRQMALMIYPRHIWIMIYLVQSIRGHPPTSPNLRLPRKMTLMIDQRSLRCAEQHWLPSNTTKYCTCHEFKIWMENAWIASAKMKTNRPWSDDNPTIKSSSRTRRFGDLTRPILERHFAWKNTTFRAPAIHEMLRLPQKVTLHLHLILPLPRKLTLTIDPLHIWHHHMLRLPRGLTLHLHQLLCLPRKMHSTLLYSSLLLYSLRIFSLLYSSILYASIISFIF